MRCALFSSPVRSMGEVSSDAKHHETEGEEHFVVIVFRSDPLHGCAVWLRRDATSLCVSEEPFLPNRAVT